MCFSFDEAGVKPVCASGSRWDAHKQAVMRQVLLKFGAYNSHTAVSSEYRSVRPADSAKLKGYYSKWADAKYPIECALFADLLTLAQPYASARKTMKWTSWERSVVF